MKCETDFTRHSVVGKKEPNVADKRVRIWLGDGELDPLAGREEWCAVYFVDELKSFGVGHW